MAVVVLVHGAGSSSWDWHLVVPLLRRAGHVVLAPDLPCDDNSAGLEQYTEVVVDAVGGRQDVALVGHSLGALTATIAADRVAAGLLVLVCPMVPGPGESPADWWEATGQDDAARVRAREEGRDPDVDLTPQQLFFQDLPPALARDAASRARNQSATPFEAPFPLLQWPDVSTRVVVGRRDRLFPLPFQRRVVRERLGLVPDEVDCGHVPALARPGGLAHLLDGYLREVLPD